MADTLDLQKWDRVKIYLGNELIRYMLADSGHSDSTALSAPQVEAANLLVRLFTGSQLEAWNALLRSHDISSKLCHPDPTTGLSLATTMHVHCGGQRPIPADLTDPLGLALGALALDVFPLFLIGGRGDGSQFDISTSMWRHPQRAAAIAALFRPEEPLMKLFPSADFEADPTDIAFDLTSYIEWSNGSGGTIQLTGIPQAILLRAHGAIKPGLSPLNSYVHSVQETLALARSLAEGKVTEVPALVGCYSVVFSEGLDEISLDKSRFRRKTPMDHALLMESPHEHIILELLVELQAVGAAEMDRSKWPTGLPRAVVDADKFHDELQDRITRARLAILLSSSDDEVLAVGQSFVSVPNPLTMSGSWGRSPLAWPVAPFHSRPLAATDAAGIHEWDQRLKGLPRGMRIGTQRLMAAVSERFNPQDGFIDAVICWENLFGAATETGLRVAGALSWVIHPDNAEARRTLFKEASDLYGSRSALVHGSDSDKKQVTVARATELRNQSVDIAMRAMRAVVRSEALRTASNSIERSKLVLINGER